MKWYDKKKDTKQDSFMAITIKTILFCAINKLINDIYDSIVLRDVVERQKTLSREFGLLLLIKDHYSKYVVFMDEHFSDYIEGVKHISLLIFIINSYFITTS